MNARIRPRPGIVVMRRVLLAAVVATGAVACSPRPPPDSPGAPDSPADATAPVAPSTPAAPAATAPSAPGSTAGSKAAPGAPPPAARPAPENAAECKAMVTSGAAGRTDATVTPAPGSGKSERFAGIVATIQDKRSAFRCCYELWAKDHPRRDARVVLGFLLDEHGAASEVHLKRAAGDALTDEAEGCIIDVAMAIAYPKSPSALITSFEYELGFKHHKAPAPAAPAPAAPAGAAPAGSSRAD